MKKSGPAVPAARPTRPFCGGQNGGGGDHGELSARPDRGRARGRKTGDLVVRPVQVVFTGESGGGPRLKYLPSGEWRETNRAWVRRGGTAGPPVGVGRAVIGFRGDHGVGCLFSSLVDGPRLICRIHAPPASVKGPEEKTGGGETFPAAGSGVRGHLRPPSPRRKAKQGARRAKKKPWNPAGGTGGAGFTGGFFGLPGNFGAKFGGGARSGFPVGPI